MKLSPLQAPLYGECVLTVQLDDDDISRADGVQDEEGAEFYLLFLGSTMRHLSSTSRVSHVTLQAVCPAHNVCEQVSVTLCLARPGGPVDPHSQENFCFVQDLALDMAHFLLDNTSPQEALLLEDEQIPLKECGRLDQNLALALKHLTPLPQKTAPLEATRPTSINAHAPKDVDEHTPANARTHPGADGNWITNSSCSSLLHLAAGHGLTAVASFLLQQPGGREALWRADARGRTPARLAEARGHHRTLELLTQYQETSGVREDARDRPLALPEGRVFRHHRRLDTFTLTSPGRRGSQEAGGRLQEEVKELRRLARLHGDAEGTSDSSGTFAPGCTPSSPSHLTCPQLSGDAAAVTTDGLGEGEDAGHVALSACGDLTLQQKSQKVPPAARNRKNKKRTPKRLKHAPQAGGETATLSPVELAEINTPRSLEQTPLPISPESGPGGAYAERKAVAPATTAIAAKQEEERREAEPLISDPVAEATRTGEAAELSAFNFDPEKVNMGQEQSLNAQEEAERQPDSAGPPGARPSDADRHPSRARYWDGGQTGSGGEWFGPEMAANTIRHLDDLTPGEATSLTVWYGDDAAVRKNTERPGSAERKVRDFGPPDSPGLDRPQLLDQGLSRPHAAGSQPALSHGPGAQRQEACRSQLEEEEEVGASREEGGGEETRSRKSSEAAEEEKPEIGDKGEKGKKKKRKKRGKRGGVEAKLSSGSSIESPGLVEGQADPLGESQDGDGAGIAAVPCPATSELILCEKVDEDAMHLPSQAEGESEDCGANPDSAYTNPGFGQADAVRTGLTEAVAPQISHQPDDPGWDSGIAASEPAEGDVVGETELVETVQPPATDLFNPGLFSPTQQTLDNAQLSDSTGEDSTILTESDCPTELPVKHPDPAVLTEDSFLEEFPEQHVRPSTSDKQPVDPEGNTSECPDCPADSEAQGDLGGARSRSFEGTADISPSQMRGGSGEAMAREYLEHCLGSEVVTDPPHKEEMLNESWAAGKEAERSRQPSLLRLEDKVEAEREEEQKYNQDLAATAVAIVTVAIASALASIEIRQRRAQHQEPVDPPLAPEISKAPGALKELPGDSFNAVRLVNTDNSAAHNESHATHAAEASHTQPGAEDPPQLEEEAAAMSEEPLVGGDDLEDLDPPPLVKSLRLDVQSNPEEEGDASPDARTKANQLVITEAGVQLPCTILDTGQGAEAADLSGTALRDAPALSEDAQTGRRSPSEVDDGVDIHLHDDPSGPQGALDKSERSDELPATSLLQAAASPSCALQQATHREAGVFKDLDEALGSLDAVDGRGEEDERKMMNDLEKEEEEEPESATVPSAESPTRSDSDTRPLQIQRETDVFYPVQPDVATTCSDVLPDRGDCGRVSVLDDNVFKKPGDPAPRPADRSRGIRVSWPSAEDPPSEGASSVGACDTKASWSSRHSWRSQVVDGEGGEEEGVGEEEERKDQLPDNPISSAILRASIRPLSPLRRHSWEPGRNNGAAEADVTQRSSLKSLSEVKRARPPLHRRSMSWCPSNLRRPDQEQIDNRSYSLEGLEVDVGSGPAPGPGLGDPEERTAGRGLRLDSQERGSLVSLTEEEQEGDGSSIDSQMSHQVVSMTTSCPAMFHHQTLTKSVSMVAIGPRDVDATGFPQSKRRISFSLSISPLLSKNRHLFSLGTSSSDEDEQGRCGGSFSSNSGSLEYSISEEEPGPLRSDTEGRGGPRISRTFSYLRSKMSKKGKEKEKRKEGERESKEREKKTGVISGGSGSHVFVGVSPPPTTSCQACGKALQGRDAFLCSNCGLHVHKSCRESLAVCTKTRTKQQSAVTDGAPGSAVNMRSKSTSSTSSVSSTSSCSSRERWSTVTTPDDQLPAVFPRRHPSIFNPHSNLAKSISTSNIAGLDDVPLKGLKFLSQSTDSLHQGSKVNASTESLTDEGTEMMDSQLMGEFEFDMKDLEADSWSGTVDKKFLKTLKKDEVKRQDVIYELYQTEFHHVRTLKIMSEVYYKGLQKELQLDTHTMDKMFPVLDDLLDTHTRFLTRLLEQKRASSAEGQTNNSFIICCVGDVLVNQFSGFTADRMKKVYGKFCSRHNEAVNLYKELYAKDKRFQAFIKRIMSSSIVRRLGIPECILLVTQRITKYPVLIQRILQHTKETDEDHGCVSVALRCVKELIMAVDSKVNEQEKKRRLREVHSRTDSKSIMRMKSGQMFAKEDLIRGRKLLHDGTLQLKNSAGRLKDAHAMLLSDVLVFLQEKDQKYVFASLDQRSTVISLQNLIVREVANEERGLFLITAGIERPEMVEVLASSKEERNTWRAIIQDAMHCMEKDEDEGVPSETEEDRRQQESRAKEIRDLLRSKDEQIISLLEEKIHIFRDLADAHPAAAADEPGAPFRERMIFRATPDDVTKGEPIIKDALSEVETLHALVNSGLGACGVPAAVAAGGGVGPVCLPRRAETFGGFDSHQMNSSKNGEKEEGDESLDLRRTESDSVLKKGATASLQMLLKRNNEQVQHSVTHLHDLLISLQAVVLQQDSFIEEQRQALSERLAASSSSRHSSSSSLSSTSTSSSRPSSLIEQEKHRSLERQRQEAASLQKQQAAHQEERRRREREWDLRERSLSEREERLRDEEEETRRRRQELLDEREALLRKKEDYQKELERLREAQRRLERDKEALRRDADWRLESQREESEHQMIQRTPSTTSEDSIRFHSSGSLDLDSREAAEEPKEVELSSSAPTKEPFLRIGSKRMGKNFNPFSSSAKTQGAEKESQLPSRLLKLAKPKDKKDKKKKKGSGGEEQCAESKVTVTSDPQADGDIFFC